MQYKDDFDDRSDFKAAVGSIFKAMGKRNNVEPRGPFWSIAIVCSLLLFLGSVLWYSYPREAEKREVMSVPIIRADAGPYKIVPNDPGGMDIPHRDSTIYDTFHADAGETVNRKVENLLPESEEPMTREQLFAGLKTQLRVEGKEVISVQKEETAPATIDITEPVAIAKTEEPAKVEETVVANAPVALTEEEDIVVAEASSLVAVPQPVKKPETDEIATAYSRTEPAAGVETFESGEGHFVQFASLRSEEAAKDTWRDLTKSLTFLQPLDHRVQRADLGARGVYYRLQAGPFDEARARAICTQFEKQRPGGCLVVKN